jgi:hypothetical protein
MVSKFIKKMQDSADNLIRGIVGRLTPANRVIVVVVMFIVFGFGSVYVTISSVYKIGKANGERMQIEHIQRLELEKSNINKEEKDYDEEK